MRDKALLISGGRLIDPSQGLDGAFDVLVKGGKVSWVGVGKPPVEDSARGETPETVFPAGGMVVCPGFIDLHCHLREPGFEEKETIATGTRAAARGGFTTICCMPNTQPALDSRATVEFVLRRAAAEGAVRVLPIGCITRGRQGQELAEMAELAEAGVVGFSDDGRPVEDSRLLRHALEYSLSFGLPIIEHCEDLALSKGGAMNEGVIALRLGIPAMPAAAEDNIVARDIGLAELTGARLHIAHVSTRGAVELVRRAKEKGLKVTAEVTPHHLSLTEERVLGNEGGPSIHAYDTLAKVNPPLRTRQDVEALIEGLKDGTIDAVATDHAPHTQADKQVEFESAEFGISGLETALGSLMTLVHSGQLELGELISRLTTGPARIIGREGLGSLRPGNPADIVIFDPEAEWVVEPEKFASKGKNTPLAGAVLKGKVLATLVGGQFAYREGSGKLP
ncbi:MAG: dihydroorotase [Chloroflexi bacterium]|nr:dihydroorotase [Chloroflexota bacterium]